MNAFGWFYYKKVSEKITASLMKAQLKIGIFYQIIRHHIPNPVPQNLKSNIIRYSFIGAFAKLRRATLA